jgi:alpha-glucosidase
MPSRRDVLKGGGALVAGGVGGSWRSAAAGAATPGRATNVDGDDAELVSAAAAEYHRRGGPGPLYWSTYGYNIAKNAQIPEAVWRANIDWVAQELAPHGYTMVCTDGWIDGDQDITSHGYIKSLSDDWEHDWAWWADYLDKRGMQLGVYYNPLWATKSAVTDRSIKVVGRPDVAVADIVNPGDKFDGGGTLLWVDASRDGAEEYVRGYVEYFRNLGAVFLRVDFLGWYEIGFDQSEGTVCVAHGRENYVQALQWMRAAAGSDMTLSLVLPNLLDHAAAERVYGDMMRIDNDLTFGQWYHLSQGRQTWQPIWSQWNNPFQGFTGFSDVSGRGQVVLDGDPLLMSSFTTDAERQTAMNLFTMAGAPIAVADQVDTVGATVPFYTNPEVLDVRRAGLVGKPVSANPHSYDYDQSSRDSERWIGQLPDGSWVVALFNRTDNAPSATRAIDFGATLGLTQPASVRDLWAHQDLGSFSTWSVTLGLHASTLATVTPKEQPRYQAEVGAFGGTARFDNTFTGHSAMGYVTGLDTAGASVAIAVAVEHPGPAQLRWRVANATGKAASLSLSVRDAETGSTRSTGTLGVPSSASWDDWREVVVHADLGSGTNLVVLSHGPGDQGAINVDSLSLG